MSTCPRGAAGTCHELLKRKLSRFELARAGQTLKVSYAPRGEEREGSKLVRKKGVKDESCVR